MKTIMALVCAALGFALAGCNTVEGAGKDIKKAGDKIEKAAERHK